VFQKKSMIEGLVVVLLVVVFAATAVAETDIERAKRHNAAAERLFNLGLFDQAAKEYQQAYRAKPVPDFLYNLAQCYRRMGTIKDLERALFYFKSYLRNAPDTPLKGVVDEAMQKTRRKLERMRRAEREREATSGPAVEAPSEPAPSRPAPFYKRWWFWTVVGGVVAAAAVTTTAVVLSGDEEPVEGTLSPGIIKIHAP
jgi:tetratricopeptide (TPR) repeat protein